MTVAPPAPAKTRTTWLPWVALVALAAGVGVWEARRPATTPENPLANAQFSRFTDWEGTEEGAEISPDGKFVAFLADRDGRVRPLAEPGRHRGFSQSHRETSRRWQPAGSSSGSSAFRATARRSGSVRAGPSMAAVAHAPDRRHAAGVPGRGRHSSAWSPDGTRLVYVNERDRDDPMFDRGSHRRRRAPDPRAARRTRSNTQSGLVARRPMDLLRRTDRSRPDEMDVWRVRPSGGSPERLTDAARGREFPGAARRAHAALRGARGGPVGAVAVGARCRDAR